MENVLDYLTYRPLRSGDYNFVLAGWAKTFRNSFYSGTCQNRNFHSQMKDTFDFLLSRGMTVILACNKENPDQLFGFVAYEVAENGTFVVHYLYVKPDWRGHKISKALLEAIELPEKFAYTHHTECSQYYPGGEYRVWLVRRKHLEPVRSIEHEKAN